MFMFFLRHGLLWMFLAFISYWIWRDHAVGRAFAARQWAIPARIFASPVELYQGMQLEPNYLDATLRQLGYKEDPSRVSPGHYIRSKNGFKIFARGYRFPEGVEPASSFDIRLTKNTVTGLSDIDTNSPLPLVRLEPIEIGSIHRDIFEDRVMLAFVDAPTLFLDILIAVEDRRFHQHIGIDPFGIARAFVTNIRSGQIDQGGSTLTQQLVKNMYLSNERSYVRKIREALMAISLERRYSKAEIVEAYMNEVFLGQDGNRAIHGFGLGARFYFGKPFADLDLAEMSTLVGMVKAPSTYNPKRHRDAAKKRRNIVLNLLLERGVIDSQGYAAASASEIVLRESGAIRTREFGAFIDLVREQLKRDYRNADLRRTGLRIYTTLDPLVQQSAQSVTATTLAKIEKAKHVAGNSLQGAMVVINPRTAEVRALIGSRDVLHTGFNRALNAKRPIGSLVKPFVYLTALEQTERFNVLSTLDDEAVNLTDARGAVWSPGNYDGKSHGQVSLRTAFVKSYNLATVNLGLEVGVKAVITRLRELGLDRELEALPSLLLGAIEMTPVEVASLFQVIANDGFKVPLRSIRSVVNAENKILTRYPPQVEQVIESSPAYLVQYLLTGVVTEGTGRAASIALADKLPLAGKTGTSNDGRDSWFAGFGGNNLSVVWVGRDDNGETGLTGASGALQLWIDLMRQVGITKFQFARPEQLSWEWVTPNGDAVVSEQCELAVRIPLALPHGLPDGAPCDERHLTKPKGWNWMRGLFR